MGASVDKKNRGRGTASAIDARYLEHNREAVDDGWFEAGDPHRINTVVTVERPKTIISRNQSPDIPFTQSINPYRGCEHGCIYCYARPTHAYLDLSPGIDFESRLFAKDNAADLLRKELNRPNYVCSPIALGANTDPYQPIERQRKITRSIIEVLAEYSHPLTIVTKSRLVERDIDLLAPMAEKKLCKVFISITTLKESLAGKMEPRASSPARRLAALTRLTTAGIPCGVLFAPVVPSLNDTEMEAVLEAAAGAGAKTAGYIMLRLPHEIKQLFREWLDTHEPMKTNHVMNMIKDIRGGRENDPNFFSRHQGSGVYADMISRRFTHTCKRLGLNRRDTELNTGRFQPLSKKTSQLTLF